MNRLLMVLLALSTSLFAQVFDFDEPEEKKTTSDVKDTFFTELPPPLPSSGGALSALGSKDVIGSSFSARDAACVAPGSFASGFLVVISICNAFAVFRPARSARPLGREIL